MEHPLAVDFVRWIVLLPLLGAAVNFLIGARLQREFGKRVERKQAELKNRDEALNIRQREIREHYTAEMGKLERLMQEALDTKARFEKTRGGGSGAGWTGSAGSLNGKKKVKS